MAVVAVLAYIFALFVIAAGILWINDRVSRALWRRRNPPEKLEAARMKYRERVLRPDWAFYERHLMRPVPDALQELFLDRDFLFKEDLIQLEDITITQFEPIDEQGLVASRKWLGHDIVPFASAEGDQIYLRPGTSESNAVYITYHDGGETVELLPDVAAFVKKVQRTGDRAA